MAETTFLYDLEELRLRLKLAQQPAHILMEAERIFREAGIVYVLLHSDEGCGVAISNKAQKVFGESLASAVARLTNNNGEEEQDE